MAEYSFDADLNMEGNRVRNGSASLLGTDFVIRDEIDTVAETSAWKAPARVATTGNINLAAPGAAIDGIALDPGDSFLALMQTDQDENGLYTWNGAAVAATRRADADTDAKVVSGMTVRVTEGTVHAGSAWYLQTEDPITLGTTNLVFAEATGGGAASAQGFTIGDGVTLDYPVVHNRGTRDVLVQLYNLSTNADFGAQIVRTDVNTVTVSFNTAPALNSVRVVIGG